MIENLGEALKIFLEKHLIPTVISVVVSIIVLIELPTEYWMITKVGRNLFFLMIAGVVFLCIQLIIHLWIGFQKLKHSIHSNNEYNKMKAKEMNENIEKWLTFVDNLAPNERDLILQFIHSNNAAITENAGVYRFYNSESIYSTDFVVKTRKRDGSQMMKLNDQFYNIMKYIYEERGSISHF